MTGKLPALIEGDRSAARGISPTGSYINAVFDNARNGRVAVGKRQHIFFMPGIVLRVVFDKRHIIFVVIITRLLAVRAAGFDIHY